MPLSGDLLGDRAEGQQVTPADIILGFLGKGPASRMAMVAVLISHGYGYDDAEAETGQAILALTKTGRIQSFQNDCFKISSGTPMEEEKAREPVSRWKQYKAPKAGADA